MKLSQEQQTYLDQATKGKAGVTANELLAQVEKDGKSGPFYSAVFGKVDKEAADLYRLEVCRLILRSWVTVTGDESTRQPIRRVMHVQVTKDRAAYIRTEFALKKKETREQLEAECEANLDSWYRKWAGILGEEFVKEQLGFVTEHG